MTTAASELRQEMRKLEQLVDRRVGQIVFICIVAMVLQMAEAVIGLALILAATR
jgi:NADH:ubiquinone oxidoreductase subunit K